MLIRLDPGSDRPIYRQIASAIGESIEDGSLAAGSRLPSARSLAETIDVNMHTVLRAYADLENLGMVVMRRGRGGVVVTGGAGLEKLVERLVTEAKRQKVPRARLFEMIELSW